MGHYSATVWRQKVTKPHQIKKDYNVIHYVVIYTIKHFLSTDYNVIYYCVNFGAKMEKWDTTAQPFGAKKSPNLIKEKKDYNVTKLHCNLEFKKFLSTDYNVMDYSVSPRDLPNRFFGINF